MVRFCVLALVLATANANSKFGNKVRRFGLGVADSFFSKAFKGDDTLAKVLKQIGNELKDIDTDLKAIDGELKVIDKDIEKLPATVELTSLEPAHAFILAEADFMINKAPKLDSETLKQKAKDYVYGTGEGTLTSARQILYDSLTGQALEDKGVTIIHQEFETTGLAPVQLMQKLVRTLGMAQALISWGTLTLEGFDSRDSDLKEWDKKYNVIWEKNHAIFDLGSCKWGNHKGAELALLCDHSEKPARVLLNGTVAGGACSASGDNFIGIPTKGTDHEEWGFDLSCPDNVIGLDGSSNHPSGHSVGYVAGFKLMCADGSKSDETRNYKTDSGSKNFKFTLKPLTTLEGCTNFPSGHHYTYLATGTFTDVSGNQKSLPAIEKKTGDACGDNDAVNFHISCPKGTCMKRFAGSSEIPAHAKVSYISCLNIQCSFCSDEVQV